MLLSPTAQTFFSEFILAIPNVPIIFLPVSSTHLLLFSERKISFKTAGL
jgi:hypothetical protein